MIRWMGEGTVGLKQEIGWIQGLGGRPIHYDLRLERSVGVGLTCNLYASIDGWLGYYYVKYRLMYHCTNE